MEIYIPNDMKKIELLRELQKYPLFTFNDFVRITKDKLSYAKNRIYRLKREGLVFGIERGKYTVHDDPMIFSTYIVLPSYISYWTALRYYNLTEQLPREIMIATSRIKSDIVFQGTRISFTKTKDVWGYEKERYMDFDIFVAEKEKAVIDCMTAKNAPFDEVTKAVERGDLDMKKLIAYALKTGNMTIAKRLGYLLEELGIDAKDLQENIDRNYVPLDWSFAKNGEKNRKWRIIDNRK